MNGPHRTRTEGGGREWSGRIHRGARRKAVHGGRKKKDESGRANIYIHTRRDHKQSS